ncbi:MULTISPECIES: polymorphic toxin type 44 domain-containing protein [unclassified Leifsonia]|uniref:polymorphic toxin type 44 domain-containing protein n=1 Tax=unclassified Leifsonia TaxID=2663824 RepID=UPI0008A75F3B|nr:MULTISPECIES: polymorphic toxin type 44 domain-containing protein [unclassified Leifsonia]SEH55147.1 LXG domain of WXG superfamily protein [Leifsonia sp. CL154]SFL23888.1 LXG domain of WXG superfamily protein [Leifsonia sp. CL147]
MGVRFSAADSSNLISAMRNNITNADLIIVRLDAGSQHLVAQLDAGVLRGAAFTAGRGLFAELILPGIAKLREAVSDIQAELASYEYAHSVIAGYGNLDHDDLTTALQEANERLRLIEEQIERNSDFLTQVQAVFRGDVEKLAHQNQVLQRLKNQVENEIEDLKEKIDKLEWFVADVSKYFSDSLEVMRLATQAAIELNKVAVEADGSYYTNGVDLAIIRGLSGARISTHSHAGLGIPDGFVVYDTLEHASALSYDKLVEWLGSEEASRLHSLARNNPGLLDSMLREAYKLKVDGDPLGALGALFNLLSENGWIALQGGQTILDKFKTNGDWDMKRYLAEDAGYESGAFYLHDEQGRVVRSDVFGNVMYGAMLAHWGVDLEVALKGANAGTAAGVDAGVNDELDDRAARYGYDLYKKYPNGLSEKQYYEEVASAKLTG